MWKDIHFSGPETTLCSIHSRGTHSTFFKRQKFQNQTSTLLLQPTPTWVENRLFCSPCFYLLATSTSGVTKFLLSSQKLILSLPLQLPKKSDLTQDWKKKPGSARKAKDNASQQNESTRSQHPQASKTLRNPLSDGYQMIPYLSHLKLCFSQFRASKYSWMPPSPFLSFHVLSSAVNTKFAYNVQRPHISSSISHGAGIYMDLIPPYFYLKI